MRRITPTSTVIVAVLVLFLVSSSAAITQGRFQQPTSRIIFEGESVRLIEWNLQANLIAVRLTGTIKSIDTIILDTVTGEEVEIPNGFAPATVVAWKPDGMTLASLEARPTVVRLWDLETGKSISYISIKAKTGSDGYPTIGSLAWDPDGNRLAIADGENLSIWNIVNDDLISVPRAYAANGVDWSPDGSKVAIVDQASTIEIIDANTLQHISLLSTDELPIGSGPALSLHYAQYLEWSPDGQRIANHYSHNIGNFIFVRDVSTGETLAIIDGHRDPVQAIAWSPDGKTLASASGSRYEDAQGDNTVRIWDMETYEQLYVLDGHTDYVTTVAWSPDSRQVASGSEDGTIRIWDIEPPQEE